LKSKV